MFSQGLTLTIIGMAIVVFFLAILVVLMRILSGVVRKIDEREARKSAESVPVVPAAAEEAAVPEETEPGSGDQEPAAWEDEDNAEIAAALALYLQNGGVLPALTGEEREDVAAVLAALAGAGVALPRGNGKEIAAAVASVYRHR